ncbi:amidohydrolase [Bradyrhizobium sp. BRP22]|uniref:amidohydrolase n=1 Tax=Bradyrhizobium sp. BRP22 TaxID=2793821 RepID=UPI001CD2594E|nr:amidohydrolase [Bradyrhizobium sp. BRP22]MCA1453654.1 amidohydrolase [Bradyrhizobium sp. BRP22]
MFLSEQDLAELIIWRRNLHRRPELSGQEKETAQAVQALLRATGADEIVTELGGHGVLGIYRGDALGPTIMLRAELDGLPIQETSARPHRSITPGKAHLCGHDGHMTILAAVARGLGRKRPRCGQALLLFQPAEEDGSGAAAVLADKKFDQVQPDFVFALHNLPGLPLGHVAIADGLVNCASRGMQIKLSGRTAHASNPELGVSPQRAVVRLLSDITGLGRGGTLDQEFSMVTVTHARLGEPAFGISPGYAEVWLTLRTLTDARMETLRSSAEQLVRRVADSERLEVDVVYRDVFGHCTNAPEAVARLKDALDAEEIEYSGQGLPLRGSEDFGLFNRRSRSAMFFLGAGVDHAGLHVSNYDFPDELIEIGSRVFMRTLRDLLG